MKIDISRLKIIITEMHDRSYVNLKIRFKYRQNIVFNVNSPKQLQDILFNQLKLPTTGIKKTPVATRLMKSHCLF